MGIPSFFSFISPRFPQTARQIALIANKSSVDRIYFDVNNLIYTAARQSSTESRFWIHLFQQFDLIIRHYKPLKSVYLALDGPGPKAKLLTQRARRLKNSQKKSNRSEISSLQFTPGTELMDKIKQALCYYATSRGSKYPDVEWIVSGADNGGEGELKIFHHISTLPTNIENPNKADSCLIVGHDADLVLYGLRAALNRNVTIFHPNAKSGTEYNINTMIEMLMESTNQDKDNKALVANIVDDFIVMSLMSGNDYIPKVRGYVLQISWVRYCENLRSNQQALESKLLFNSSTSKFNLPLLKTIMASGHDLSGPIIRDSRGLFTVSHPRSLLGTLTTKYFKSTPIYEEIEEKSSQRWKVEVFVSADSSQQQKIWLASAFGRTAKEAVHLAALNGLKSQILLNLVKEKHGPIASEQLHASLVEQMDMIKHELRSILTPFSDQNNHMTKDQINAATLQNPGIVEGKTEEERRKMAEDCLTGIAWVSEYFSGRCRDYGYLYPFRYSPSINHIINSVPASFVPKLLKEGVEKPMNPIEFCFSLMPLTGEKYIPTEFKPLISDSSISDLYSKPEWVVTELDSNLDRIQNAVRKYIEQRPQLAAANTLKPSLCFRHKNYQQSKHSLKALESFTFTPPAPPSPAMKPLDHKSPMVCLIESMEHQNQFIVGESQFMKKKNDDLENLDSKFKLKMASIQTTTKQPNQEQTRSFSTFLQNKGQTKGKIGFSIDFNRVSKFIRLLK